MAAVWGSSQKVIQEQAGRRGQCLELDFCLLFLLHVWRLFGAQIGYSSRTVHRKSPGLMGMGLVFSEEKSSVHSFLP